MPVLLGTQHTIEDIHAHLKRELDQYTYSVVKPFFGGPRLLVSHGTITGLSFTLRKGKLSNVWVVPNKLVMFALILFTVATGIVPGLFVVLIIWLVAREKLNEMRTQIHGSLVTLS